MKGRPKIKANKCSDIGKIQPRKEAGVAEEKGDSDKGLKHGEREAVIKK